MALTPKQIELVKATVPVVQEHGFAITTLFYGNVIGENPALNNIFNHTNQVNHHQPRALAGALFAYAANIDNLAVLGPAVERIAQKHASLFIQPEHYPIVGKYLLAAMGEVLGPALTPDILDAWTAAYTQLADVLIGAEKALYTADDKDSHWTDWRDFVIKRKVVESDEITSFYLSPVDGKPLPSFNPGQYISVRTEVPELKYLQPRQYSLSDAPRDDYYRISVRRDDGLNLEAPGIEAHPGYISNILHRTKNEGDVLQVSHPHGEFFLEVDDKASSPVVLISAGVGQTPLLSILNTLVAHGSTRPISWVHGVRKVSEQAFASHVNGIAARHSNVHTTVFVKSPSETDVPKVHYTHAGRLDLAKLDMDGDLFLTDKSAVYYVCGPGGFMVAVEQALLALGVDASRIKLELFGTGDLPRA